MSKFKKSDTEIQEDVINEIKWDPSITANQVSVTVKDGIVTLHGSVPHYFEKSRSEDAAQRVSDVRAVADELEVNLMGSYERSDSQIAEAALNALEWSYSVPKGLRVTVEKGWITLKGETEWDYQRNAAKDAISQLMGVCGVNNQITIKSKVRQDDIKVRIEQALKRTAEKDSKKITVSVKGDKVTLSGKVQSFTERSDARLAAWMAPGVMTVENNLLIGH